LEREMVRSADWARPGFGEEGEEEDDVESADRLG